MKITGTEHKIQIRGMRDQQLRQPMEEHIIRDAVEKRQTNVHNQ